MKVCGLNIDFNPQVVKDNYTFAQFTKAYRGKIPNELLRPAYEKLTGKKVTSRRKSSTKKK